MILTVDVGNTNMSFGVFNSNLNLLSTFNLSTQRNRTAFEIMSLLNNALNHFKIKIEDILKIRVASVVPEINRELNILFQDIYNKDTTFIQIEHIDVNINLENPLELGIDRLINVFSAFHFYPKIKNTLIIDSGTAITFDLGYKTKNNLNYEGGIIFPGVNLSIEALKNGTSKLPQISLKPTSQIIGKSTSEAINSGIFYGYTSMINGVVSQIQKQHEDLTIIVTGGFGKIFQNYFNFEFTLDENLTLKGIAEIPI